MQLLQITQFNLQDTMERNVFDKSAVVLVDIICI